MKRKRVSVEYDLPSDLQEEIQLKLPVKSLLRFRSVCKSWNSVITNPNFVKEYLQANIRKRNAAFSNGDVASSVSGLLDLELEQNRALSLVTFREDFFGRSRERSYIGFHCNGIACLVGLSTNQLGFSLYNPALRQQEFIRAPSEPRAFGFGYDHKTDDYKFVGITRNKAEVYSLRTGLWRELKTNSDCSFICKRGAYVKGSYYWVDYTSKNILYFDMSDESFGRVDLPRAYSQMGVAKSVRAKPNLIARGADSLAFVIDSTFKADNYRPRICSYEMFVMDGDRGGWTQHFRIGLVAGIARPRPVAFLNDEEVLMEGQDCYRVCSFNLRTKKLTDFPERAAVKGMIAFGSLYVEALCSVQPKLENQ